MDSSEVHYLFKETRLNLEPAAPSCVATIRVPSNASSSWSQRKLTHAAANEDETNFRLKNLATASSIYHRQWHDSPRSFLWRVLDDGELLSLRVVDVCQPNAAVDDANIVLNFHFTVPIQPGCVALADPKEHDALCVYVLDRSSQLYTFTLRSDLFRKRSALDAGLSDLGKVQSPAGLGFKHPHRMVAVAADILLITVNDGGMIRFDRAKGEDASKVVWKETFFNVQGWAQNLRSLLPFQGKHMIKHGKVNMEYSAATAIQTSSLGHEDALFAITVCLDHRLRIWNLEDGQILYTGDILNTERPPQEIGRWSIDPSQSNLVQIVGRNRGQRICATFSPVGAGEFKFWKIIAKDAHTIIVEDLFPQTALVPITPSTSDVWTLADFKLGAPVEGSINLWTLWKNNMTYRVQRLQLDRKDMARSWESGWDGVFAESAVATTPVSGPADASDVTENWLELILQPGRFSRPTLETALSIYERVLGGSREGGKGRSLAESVCALIGSTTTLDRGSSGTMEYDQFRASSETHWRRFYRVLMEMDKQRGEAIELALDPEADMAWVVCADLLSAVRECSDLEQVYHNISRPEEGREQQAALIDCAIAFVDGFSDNFLQLCNSVLRHEMYSEPSKTDFERIQYFSDKAGFWRGITEDDCAQVIDALGENFTMVTDELYEEMMDLFAAPVAAKGRKPRQPLTGFGRKLFLRATLGNLELHWKIAFSQLVLLVHMEFEFDKEEDALHHRVDIGLVFRQLISILQRLELVKWLANTELPVPLNSDKIQPITKKAKDETQLVTALEANIGHLLGFSFVPGESVGVCMSNLVTNFCAANSDIEVSPTLIQCAFMKRERADLALAMAPFCDQNPFSIYILGRVLLALKDFEGAAQEFRKAAIGMSTNSVSSDRHSCGLLDDNEWNLLNNGQGRYYSHIVALYEKHRAYFHVIDFSRLALQFLGTENDTQFTKTDLQSRMFNAAVATSQFELAHMSLQSFQDNVLRQSSLRKLVDRMCETSHNAALLELTFPEMQQEVDDILFQRCKSTMDVLGSQFHQVLYSWRIKRGNFRGAASVLLDRIEKLKFAGEADRLAGDDGLDTPVTKQYLLLINALSCVDPEQSWVFDEGNAEWERNGGAPTKRKVVSLADVRKQYQDELDRIAAIQNNQFSFAVDDVMEVA